MMDERKYAFLKAVLGTDGAFSLKKAADKYEDLEGAIVPRAIMAWLGVVGRGDYEGGLPGVDDSYLDFSKNSDSTYDGSIAIGEGVFPFQNASVFHLAASVALSLGASLESQPLKDVDVMKLGKSIDVLVKAKYLSGMDVFAKAIPGPPNKPQVRGQPVPPTPGTKQIGQPKPIASQKPAEAPKQAKMPKHKIPQLKVKTPKKAAKLTAKALKSECGECGQPLVKNEAFVGCLCFRDLARYVSLTKHDNEHYEISFGSGVDEDGELAILEALGVNHG
jgi:hypothetical protein